MKLALVALVGFMGLAHAEPVAIIESRGAGVEPGHALRGVASNCEGDAVFWLRFDRSGKILEAHASTPCLARALARARIAGAKRAGALAGHIGGPSEADYRQDTVLSGGERYLADTRGIEIVGADLIDEVNALHPLSAAMTRCAAQRAASRGSTRVLLWIARDDAGAVRLIRAAGSDDPRLDACVAAAARGVAKLDRASTAWVDISIESFEDRSRVNLRELETPTENVIRSRP